MTRGGLTPGGSWRSTAPETAVTCAVAVRMSVPGWKKIFTIPMPCSDWLSRCSMSLTMVVSPR